MELNLRQRYASAALTAVLLYGVNIVGKPGRTYEGKRVILPVGCGQTRALLRYYV